METICLREARLIFSCVRDGKISTHLSLTHTHKKNLFTLLCVREKERDKCLNVCES